MSTCGTFYLDLLEHLAKPMRDGFSTYSQPRLGFLNKDMPSYCGSTKKRGALSTLTKYLGVSYLRAWLKPQTLSVSYSTVTVPKCFVSQRITTDCIGQDGIRLSLPVSILFPNSLGRANGRTQLELWNEDSVN